MPKTIVTLEQKSGHAESPHQSGFETPRGYQVKEIKDVECDHPDTTTRCKDGEVVEKCRTCGETERQEITTNLERSDNDD